MESNDHVVKSVTIESQTIGRKKLWYQLPIEYSNCVTKSCDPFVVATLFLSMTGATDLHIHGEVSPSLLRNLEEFQAVWSCWRPKRYTKIEIIAEFEREQEKKINSDRAVLCFSGGVDSCFSAWRHRGGNPNRQSYKLQAGIMVHGFDIPLDQPDIFELALKRSAMMLQSIGMDIIPIGTNFRELEQTSLGKLEQDWEDCHGAGLASCLLLLQDGYDTGLIASSSPYNALKLPSGSNPISDRMFSSNTFKIIHDGASFIRREKIREITKWPEAMKYLRVCWEGKNHDRNCGCCEKCVRTILSFRVMGYGLPDSFEQDITDDHILALMGLDESKLYHLEEILSVAKFKSINESWVKALEKCVKKNRKMAEGRKDFWKKTVEKFGILSRLSR
jgi:hypothetical protein